MKDNEIQHPALDAWKKIQKGLMEELKHIKDQTKDPEILKSVKNIKRSIK